MAAADNEKTYLPDGNAARLMEQGTVTSGDQALLFLKQHDTASNFAHDASRMRALRRKIDSWVIPFLTLAYLMNFLDKTLLNYANVMGLSKQLHLRGNDYTNVTSAFFIAVLIADFPNVYLLQRLSTTKWLAFCLFGWAIATACVAACNNYTTLLVARIFCGIFESGIPPALILISGQWYRKDEQITRFVWWYMGTPLGLIFGGLISWGFQHVGADASLAGWRIMFIVLGLVTFLLSVLTFLLVPDTPMRARFLSDSEKVSLLEHIKVNKTGVDDRSSTSLSQLREAFLDFQLWCQWLIIILVGSGGGVLTAYSATLIKGFGYTPKHAALLNMISGAVAAAFCLLTSYGIRFFGNRWLFLIATIVPAIIGAACMAYLPATNKPGRLAGIYLISSIFGTLPIQFSWISANVAGHTKRACATSLLNAAFAIGNIIGPQTFRAKDAPAYTPAIATFMSFQCVVVVLAVALLVYYRFENAKRDQRSEGDGVASTEDAFSGLTDKRNPRFRYVY